MEIFQRKFDSGGTFCSALILAGLHGNQYTSIFCLKKFQELVQRSGSMFGFSEISLVNFVNLSGIQNFSRETQSGIDLNREFSPGKSSCPEVKRIKELIYSADVVIDLHSSFGSMVFCYLNFDKYLPFYSRFLRGLGIPYTVSEQNNPTVKKFTNRFREKLGFTLEMNQSGENIDQDSALLALNYIKRILLNTGSGIRKTAQVFDTLPVSFTVSSDYFGLLSMSVRPGDKVSAGQKIGEVAGIDGKRRNFIVSPSTGMIVAMPKSLSYVVPGQPIVIIQPSGCQ